MTIPPDQTVDQLEREIEDAIPRDGETAGWTARPLSELIDHIVTAYHEPLYAELPELVRLTRRVCMVHGPSDRERFDALLAAVLRLEADLVPHMRKEESVLFPWIRAGGGLRDGAVIRVMRTEHDELAVLLEHLRELTDDYVAPDHACGSWRALWHGLEQLERSLREHVHLENHILFPRALS